MCHMGANIIYKALMTSKQRCSLGCRKRLHAAGRARSLREGVRDAVSSKNQTESTQILVSSPPTGQGQQHMNS